jgi:hypothetical protein
MSESKWSNEERKIAENELWPESFWWNDQYTEERCKVNALRTALIDLLPVLEESLDCLERSYIPEANEDEQLELEKARAQVYAVRAVLAKTAPEDLGGGNEISNQGI